MLNCIQFWSIQFFAGVAIAFQHRSTKNRDSNRTTTLNALIWGHSAVGQLGLGTFTVAAHVKRSAVTENIACWKPPALQLKSLHIIQVVPCNNHVVSATSSKQDGPGYFLWICYSTFLANSVLMQGLGLCLRCSRTSALRIWKIMPKCWMKMAAQLKWRH